MAARKSRSGARRGKAKRSGVTWAAVRKLALSFPGVTEGRSYGDEAFLLDGKFFSRFHPKEEALVVYVQEPLRDALLDGKPDVYFTTDHYRNYPYVLARLDQLPRAELAALYEEGFRAKAKRKVVEAWEAKRAPRAKSPKRAQRAKRGS